VLRPGDLQASNRFKTAVFSDFKMKSADKPGIADAGPAAQL
jgi:hypothetical protein